MIALKIAGVLLVLFGAGLATSFAEYKFQYSLYQTFVEKVFGKKV